ncbi:major tail protein [Gordonia phage Emalyn]|uniref:Major tail protein n=1 Tax=Gordonia phage Emalyn TaxID=1821552 RepID=A0A142KBU8_9CAUD|nr:major tail protein [Gordonia phage Emalyn]AMS03581.1 major tail protein [Gordonia phage Emalyn]QXN73580.1 major tail protein [Gordonia phage AikoCarson]
MASKVENVFAAMPRATGALLRGPKGGGALPTSAKTDITSAEYQWLIDQGYIGEDGFTQSESRDTDKKKAFGGKVVKVLQTDYSLTIQFAFLESINAEVLKSIYGEENVEVREDGEIVVHKNSKQSPHAAWVIDVYDGDALNRSTIADGQITEVDDIVKVHSDTIMYTVTMECFEDENGDNMVEYFAPAGSEAVLTVSTATLTPANEDEAYSATLASVGGEGAKTWTVTAGALPAGVTLSSAGVLSGTPTEAGSFDFTVKVTDSATPTPAEATKGLTLVVNAA